MIKGSVFTISILTFILSVAWGVLNFGAASMSDNPSAAENVGSTLTTCFIVAVLSVMGIISAFFIPI